MTHFLGLKKKCLWNLYDIFRSDVKSKQLPLSSSMDMYVFNNSVF